MVLIVEQKDVCLHASFLHLQPADWTRRFLASFLVNFDLVVFKADKTVKNRPAVLFRTWKGDVRAEDAVLLIEMSGAVI